MILTTPVRTTRRFLLQLVTAEQLGITQEPADLPPRLFCAIDPAGNEATIEWLRFEDRELAGVVGFCTCSGTAPGGHEPIQPSGISGLGGPVQAEGTGTSGSTFLLPDIAVEQIDGVGLGQDGIELVLANELAGAVTSVLLAVERFAVDRLRGTFAAIVFAGAAGKIRFSRHKGTAVTRKVAGFPRGVIAIAPSAGKSEFRRPP